MASNLCSLYIYWRSYLKNKEASNILPLLQVPPVNYSLVQIIVHGSHLHAAPFSPPIHSSRYCHIINTPSYERSHQNGEISSFTINQWWVYATICGYFSVLILLLSSALFDSMDYSFLVPITSFSCLPNNIFQKLTHYGPQAKGRPSPIFVNISYWSTIILICLFICLWLPLELNSWDKYLITKLEYLFSYLLQKNFVNLCYIICHFFIKQSI